MFCTSKIWLLDLHWVKIMFNANFKILYSKKKTYLDNLCDRTCIFHELWKKLIKHFAEKQFIVFGGTLMNASEHTKTSMQFLLLADFLHTKCSDIVKLCDLYCKSCKSALHTIFTQCKSKTHVFWAQNIPKVTLINKFCPKKNSWEI